MSLICWYFDVIEARGGGDDGVDIVLSHQILVGGRVEVPKQESPCVGVLVGRQDDVVGPVLFLSIIIMKHQLL